MAWYGQAFFITFQSIEWRLLCGGGSPICPALVGSACRPVSEARPCPCVAGEMSCRT
jgi:hypothetical protein